MTSYLRTIGAFFILIIAISCDRNKSPIENQSAINLHDVQSWPAFLEATGIGYPELSLPLPQQRALAIRQAKLSAISDLDSLIGSLPINSIHSINYLTVSDTLLHNKLIEYIKGSYHILDTRYISDGSVEIDMSISTDGIIPIINE